MRRISLVGLVFLGVSAAPLVAQQTCQGLTSLALEHATITSATAVPEGPVAGGGRGGGAKDGVAFMEFLEVAAREKIKPLPINVDGALAAVLHDLGFSPPAGKLLFIVGRVAGLTAEVAEEYAREKAMRIRIPVEYDGVPPRPLD